jgi:hypothetical protein
MLEHLDDELGRQLRQKRCGTLHLAQHRGVCGGIRSGEESVEHTRVGGSFRALLWAEESRSRGALAGGGAESVEGGVGHGRALWLRVGAPPIIFCEFTVIHPETFF